MSVLGTEFLALTRKDIAFTGKNTLWLSDTSYHNTICNPNKKIQQKAKLSVRVL